MENKSKSSVVAAAIVFSAVAVSGSLVFAGVQFGAINPDDLKADIRTGIDEYVEEKEAEFQADQAAAQAEANKPKVVDVDLSDDDAVLGDEDAPVTIVEFSDFQCPYCAKFYEEAYQQIKSEYVEKGLVKVIFRDYPLDFHPGAYPAALAAECAGDQGDDEAYYAMHDIIFENQEVLSGDLDSIYKSLSEFADEIGVDSGKFDECMESDKFEDEIYADMADAQNAGIQGTPNFVVNGTILSGSMPFDNFKVVIDEALAKVE